MSADKLSAEVNDNWNDGLAYQTRLIKALAGDGKAYISYRVLAELAEELRAELAKLRLDASGRYIKGGEGSHWDGCEETHFDCKIAKLEKENAKLLVDLEDARDIINHGVELMPLEQLSKWEGVRAWLELSGGDK
jgi:hypothetical protein